MGWRMKFVFVLIVYCAGFITAVYCLAPTPRQGDGQTLSLAQLPGSFNSQELAASVSSGIHKCVDLGKVAAAEVAQRIQKEIGKAQSESGQ